MDASRNKYVRYLKALYKVGLIGGGSILFLSYLTLETADPVGFDAAAAASVGLSIGVTLMGFGVFVLIVYCAAAAILTALADQEHARAHRESLTS